MGELSPTLLERYLSAARKISRLAIGSPVSSVGGEMIVTEYEKAMPGMIERAQNLMSKAESQGMPESVVEGLRDYYQAQVDAKTGMIDRIRGEIGL